MTMAVDAVVFDLDETLFDHRGAARDGVAAWLSNLG
jgi:FMN phosphatase YigB (HAD superfamily)